jgi:hypothetical protein
MNRRRFFAACAAPFLARFAPKPISVVGLVEARYRTAAARMNEMLAEDMYVGGFADNVFQQSPVFVRLSRKPGAVFTGGLSMQRPITINREGWYGDADL